VVKHLRHALILEPAAVAELFPCLSQAMSRRVAISWSASLERERERGREGEIEFVPEAVVRLRRFEVVYPVRQLGGLWVSSP
jgi:hypothetical protein